MLENKRSIFQEGLNTEITQGSIFINAYSASYQNSVNYGLIITARCDISQRKAQIHSYLPIVSLADWLSLDFLRILEKRARSQVENSLVAQFEAIGGSRLLFKTYGVKKIKEHFVDSPPNNKQKKFLEILDKFELLSFLDEPSAVCTDPSVYLRSFEKLSANILRELVGQSLSGFYFLDDVCGDGPHVILLREIYHISEANAYSLRYGCRIDDGAVNYNDDDDCSYTIGVVRSPYIEHIMQKFAELFTRIGIEDPEPDAVQKILRGFAGE